MKNPRCCEHTEENAGPCLRCRQPMQPRPVKFVGSKQEWKLMWQGKILRGARSLSDMLEIMVHVGEEQERYFMMMCPNGVKLSVEVARKLGV